MSTAGAFDDLVEANRRNQAGFALRGLTGRPARGLAVLTCVDTRIDPLAVLGLTPGDAKILRNAGARVTDDVVRSLALVVAALGVERVALIAHTDCAVAKATDDELRALVAEASWGRRRRVGAAGHRRPGRHRPRRPRTAPRRAPPARRPRPRRLPLRRRDRRPHPPPLTSTPSFGSGYSGLCPRQASVPRTTVVRFWVLGLVSSTNLSTQNGRGPGGGRRGRRGGRASVSGSRGGRRARGRGGPGRRGPGPRG